MARTKGSKNKKVDVPSLKNQIQKINARLKAIKKEYGEDVAKYYSNKLSLPSSDFIKNGKITTSEKKWSTAMEVQKKAMMKVDIPTVQGLRTEARETLEESGIAEAMNMDSLSKSDVNEMLVKEVQARIMVEEDFDQIIEDYYEFMDKFGYQLDNEDELRSIRNELATGQGSGIKSYSELADWMARAKTAMDVSLGRS